MESISGKVGKSIYFRHIIEIEQPYALTGPQKRGSFLSWLRYRKWLMLFSLKFQRENRKNALAVDSAKGKTGKKAILFTAL